MAPKCKPQEEPKHNEPSKPKTELNKPKIQPKIKPKIELAEPNEPKIEPKIEPMNKPEKEEAVDDPKATYIQSCKDVNIKPKANAPQKEPDKLCVQRKPNKLYNKVSKKDCNLVNSEKQ
eukprot:15253374-Ditylum_brightwellii.AAC.1